MIATIVALIIILGAATAASNHHRAVKRARQRMLYPATLCGVPLPLPDDPRWKLVHGESDANFGGCLAVGRSGNIRVYVTVDDAAPVRDFWPEYAAKVFETFDQLRIRAAQDKLLEAIEDTDWDRRLSIATTEN